MAAKSWFYLSFARDGQFVGACMVEALSHEDAPRVAAEHGISPGDDDLVNKPDVMVIPSPGPGSLPPYRLFSRDALKTVAGLYELRRDNDALVVIDTRSVN